MEDADGFCGKDGDGDGVGGGSGGSAPRKVYVLFPHSKPWSIPGCRQRAPPARDRQGGSTACGTALGEAQAGDGDASFRCLVPGPLTEMVGLITPSPFPLAVTLFELTVVNNWYIIMVRTLASSWERLPLTLWGQLCVSLHPVWGPCPSHGLRGVASWATGSAFCGRPLRGPRTTPWLDMAFVPATHPQQPGDAQPLSSHPPGRRSSQGTVAGFPSLNSSKCHPTRGRLTLGTIQACGAEEF